MITAVNVTKHFGEVTAVNDISVTIRSGEVFGLIGTMVLAKAHFCAWHQACSSPTAGKFSWTTSQSMKIRL